MIPVATTMAVGKLIKDPSFQPTPRLRIASLSSFGARPLDSPCPSARPSLLPAGENGSRTGLGAATVYPGYRTLLALHAFIRLVSA
jgi:hypothetical protein